MKKHQVSYTFVNPNRAEAFERVLCKILVEKLVSGQTQSAAA